MTDEIYSELTFEGEHTSIASLPGMKARTIFLHGFSKAYAMTGFRIGYACGPADIIEAMMRIHQYSMLCASIISQEAALEAIGTRRGGHDGNARAIPRCAAISSSTHSTKWACLAICRAALFTPFPAFVPPVWTSKEFALRLLETEKVACVPGSAFGPSGEGFLRCCFATSLDRIEEATKRMERFVAGLR